MDKDQNQTNESGVNTDDIQKDEILIIPKVDNQKAKLIDKNINEQLVRKGLEELVPRLNKYVQAGYDVSDLVPIILSELGLVGIDPVKFAAVLSQLMSKPEPSRPQKRKRKSRKTGQPETPTVSEKSLTDTAVVPLMAPIEATTGPEKSLSDIAVASIASPTETATPPDTSMTDTRPGAKVHQVDTATGVEAAAPPKSALTLTETGTDVGAATYLCPKCGQKLLRRKDNKLEGKFWWGCSGWRKDGGCRAYMPDKDGKPDFTAQK